MGGSCYKTPREEHDGEFHDLLSNNKKDQRQIRAMVLLFIPNSREISFRLDDCRSQKAGQLLPIGVLIVYAVWGQKSIYCLGLS
jgi:hypothetical protein